MSLVDSLRGIKVRIAGRLAPQHVVYHHVPKCGGTSVGRALRMRYLLSQETILTEPAHRSTLDLHPQADALEQWNQTMRFREAMLLYWMHADTRCIAAHVGFSRVAFDRFHERYVFVTLLRDPVERFLSHYRHSFGRDDHSGIDLPLEAFIETAQGRSFGTRYVQYFRGEPRIDGLETRSAIEEAKRNLTRFAAVGFIDRMSRFEERLRSVLRVRLRIGHENRGGGSGAALAPPDSGLRRRIEDVCAPDLEIYAHARTHWA